MSAFAPTASSPTDALGGGKRQLHSVDLDRIGEVDKKARADGSGTIIFEPGSVAARLLSTGPMRVSMWNTDVDAVARIIEERRVPKSAG